MSSKRDCRRVAVCGGLRAVRAVVFLAAVGVLLFVVFHWGDRLLADLDDRARYYRSKLGSRLGERHGLIFYAPFDGPNPANVISGKFLLHRNLPLVRGVVGGGRLVDDDRKAFLQTDWLLRHLGGGSGTLAFWFRPLFPDDCDEARIFWCSSGGRAAFGVRQRGGNLEVVCTGTNGQNTISVPFAGGGEFHHVAVVVEPASFTLYVDGRERGARGLPGGMVPPHLRAYLGGNPRTPAAVELDEMAVWARPLDGHEIGELFTSRRRLSARYEPFVSLQVCLAEACGDFLRLFFRVADRLAPHGSGFAFLRKEVPSLEIRWSKRDARHFRNAYEKTIGQGERTRKATRYREVSLVFGGHRAKAELCLDDFALHVKCPARYSFVAKVPEGFPGAGGSRMFRLYPLERYGELHPDALRPLPLSPRNLVRLFVQGDFQGFYRVETLDCQGSAWVVAGARDPRRTHVILYGAQPAMPADEKMLPEAEVERRFREMGALARSDMRFPWSGQELKWRAETHARRRAAMCFAVPALTAGDLKGENPSDFYVVTNLALSVAGGGVSWTSSDPSVVGADGAVCRPEGDLPVLVVLSGEFPGGERRDFRFRVMPRSPRLPALHLYISLPLEKKRDRDFTCLRFPAGGGAACWLAGTAGMGGGVHHRGNTSYVRGAKRSMSLEFDEGIDAGVTDRPSRHLLLLSGYADATKMRNKLSFDAFQLMRGGEAAGRRSPRIAWSEVFVNGEYVGVWEVASRFQDAAGADFSQLFKIRTLNGLWQTAEPEFLTFVGKPPFLPGTFEGVIGLSRFVIGSDKAAFLAGLEEHFDLDALADFLLLVNMTGNEDGRTTNQFLGRRKADGKWECLPWDYDKTFIDKSSKDTWLSNPLFARLQAESPDFSARLKRRWAMHRSGPLSDANVLGWVDRMGDFLAPCMEEEFRLLQPIDTEGDFREQLGRLRAEVAFRLHQLDRRMGLCADDSAAP